MSIEMLVDYVLDSVEELFNTFSLSNKSAIVDMMFYIAVIVTVVTLVLRLLGIFCFISLGESLVSVIFIAVLKYGSRFKIKRR